MSPALGCGISIARLMAPLHVANDPLAATAARSASTERTAACNTAAAWVGTRRAATSAAVAGGADGSCSGVGGGHLPPRNGGIGILSARGCIAAEAARTGSITCHRGNAARLAAPLRVSSGHLAAATIGGAVAEHTAACSITAPGLGTPTADDAVGGRRRQRAALEQAAVGDSKLATPTIDSVVPFADATD